MKFEMKEAPKKPIKENHLQYKRIHVATYDMTLEALILEEENIREKYKDKYEFIGSPIFDVNDTHDGGTCQLLIPYVDLKVFSSLIEKYEKELQKYNEWREEFKDQIKEYEDAKEREKLTNKAEDAKRKALVRLIVKEKGKMMEEFAQKYAEQFDMTPAELLAQLKYLA